MSVRRITVLALVCGLAPYGCGSSPPPAAEPGPAPTVATSSAEPGQCRELATVGADGTVTLERSLDERLARFVADHPENAAQVLALVDGQRDDLTERIESLRGHLRAEAASRAVAARCNAHVDVALEVRVGGGSLNARGRILLPGVDVPLAGARLTISTDTHVLAETVSDGCGRFAFVGLVAGSYTLEFAVRTFRGQRTIELGGAEPDADVVLRVATEATRIATIQGVYDSVEVVLAAGGVPHTVLSSGCLSDPRLHDYDVVFINCSSRPPRDAEIENIRAFAAHGGGLYFSDLTLPLIQSAFPGRLAVATATGGTGTQWARAVDPELASFMGHGRRFEILFDLPNWRYVNDGPDDVRVLVAGERPYSMLFSEGAALVGFTSFHYRAQLRGDELWSLVYFLTRL